MYIITYFVAGIYNKDILNLWDHIQKKLIDKKTTNRIVNGQNFINFSRLELKFGFPQPYIYNKQLSNTCKL